MDLGCGTGTNVITLARNGWDTTGIDFAPRAIQEARKKARQAGVQADLRVEDVSRLKGISGPFDLILDIGCLHGLPLKSMDTYIENLPALLSLNGSFLLYTFLKGSDNSGIGLTVRDLEFISDQLDLVARKDGTERGIQPSAWFTYKRIAEHVTSPGNLD